MAIHDIVESVEQRDNKLVYSIVVFTSDEDSSLKQREEFVVNPPTPENLTAQVNAKANQIQSQLINPSAFKALLSLQGTEIPITPAPIIIPPQPPTPPTPEEIAKQVYREKVNKYRQFKGALAVGIKVQTELDAVTAELISDYLPGYEIFFTTFI